MNRYFLLQRPLACVAFALALFCFTSRASMVVYPMETSVDKNGSAQIKVLSQSDEVQFIKVSLKRITNPGTPNEKEVPADISSGEALIVTPQKLALTAGGERIVRLVSLSFPPKETTWRVYFESVSENIFNKTNNEESPKRSTAEVGVSIVWGALVHVAPAHTIVSLKYTPDSAEVMNSGTIRLPLRELAICDTTGACSWKKETSTLYPGTTIRLANARFSPEKKYRVKYYNWLKNATEEIELPASQVN